MKCANHAEKNAEHICQECNKPICSECAILVDQEAICKGCLEIKYKDIIKHKEGKLAKIFHFFCSLVPGAGQMQQGAMRRGTEIMLAFVLLAVISTIFRAEEILMFCVVIWFYSFFDSYHVKRSKRFNMGERDNGFIKREVIQVLLEKQDRKWVAWGLIGLGGLALFNTVVDLGRYFFHSRIAYLLQNSILPLAAIIIGWSILKKSQNINNQEEVLEEKIIEEEQPEVTDL